MRKKARLCMLIFLLALALTGCQMQIGPDTQEAAEKLPNRIFTDKGLTVMEEQDPDWLETGDFSYTASEHAYIHLFIDGSTSMKGYTIPSDSLYDRILISLNAVAANTFSSVTLDVYKFFDQVYLMKDKDRSYRPVAGKYIDFVHRTDFYGTVVGVKSGEIRTANRDRSDYGQVLDQMLAINKQLSRPGSQTEMNDLFIIVSDFIPQDNRDTDFYRFTNRLYGAVLKNDLCCGIAAFRSAFEGDLQGIDRKYLQRKYDYDGKLPFYVMAIGQTANVSKFMDELDKTVRYQDISEEDYGVLITDGQAPRNTGGGNSAELIWDADTDMRLIHENEVAALQMVSEELLENSENVTNGAYLNQQVFTIFPADQYGGGPVTFNGEIVYTLPYEIAPTSNIAIEDEGWILDIKHTAIQGEREIEAEVLEGLRRQCSAQIKFPLDMSKEAFQQVYGTKVPRPEPWESEEDVQSRIWRERRAAYDEMVPARTVCEDEQALVMGAPYVTGGDIHMPFSIHIQDMAAEMPYLYSIDISAMPKISAKPMPDWVSDWNVDDEDVESWAKNPTAFDRPGTPNLANAVKALQGDRINDEGEFERQINLVFAKSERTIPDALREALITEMKTQSVSDVNSPLQDTEGKNTSVDPGQIFNIFRRGEK